MNALIQAAEVWVPDLDAGLLEYGGGLYGDAVEFGFVSRSMCFGRGEGLPGKVWEEGRPIMMKDLQSAHFRRAAAAREANLVCAVAWPIYFGDILKAVVVCFVGGESPQAGAIEIWRNDPRVTTDITLLDGYYGALAQSFVNDSADTSLPRGVGLPGLAWQGERAVLLDDLPMSAKFVRAESAASAGIERGLALPCHVPTRDQYVLTFLATKDVAIAPRLETWRPIEDGQAYLQREYGNCATAGRLPCGLAARVMGVGRDSLSTAYASAAPVVTTQLAEEIGPHGAAALAAGLRGLLAIPVVSGADVVETLALYL